MAVALLAVLLLAVLLIRRRRGRRQARATTAVALALLCAAAGLGVDVRPAHADVSLVAGDDDIRGTYGGCVGQISSFDPTLWDELNKKGSPTVHVFPHYKESQHQPMPGGGPRDSSIIWNFYDKSRLLGEEKARLDPCASLYHELVHALDRARGQEHAGDCGDTKVPYDEVRATIEENKFRARYHLDQRDKYDGKKIPKALADCDKKKAPPKRADNSRPVMSRGQRLRVDQWGSAPVRLRRRKVRLSSRRGVTAVASSRPDCGYRRDSRPTPTRARSR